MNSIDSNFDQYRNRLKLLFPVLGIIGVAIGVSLISDLARSGRLSLLIFGITVITWTSTKLNVSYVAIFAALTSIVTGVVPQARMFESLGDRIVWLMIGAFMLGAAVKQTGLARRLTQFIVSRVRTVESLFWLMTLLIVPLSFVIPSTSGRAALMLPVFRSVTSELRDRRITRALSLLIPAVILVSTIVSLVGAGSHLIANELLTEMVQQHISFGQWAIYGLPFGLVASLLTCWVIMQLFLDRHQRRQLIQLETDAAAVTPWTRAEWITLTISFGMVSMWLTESIHGLELATVAIGGGVLLAVPKLGVLSWKDALNSVSWNLIMFVSSALVLGKSLVESGAAKWIVDRTFYLSGIGSHGSQGITLALLTLIALTSHLYMTSHAARAVALVPALISLGTTLDLNPVAVMFIGTLGMDYCLTMPISSKALLVYQDGETQTFLPQDLFRLSSVMLPLHLGLVVIFYHTYWRWVGLSF
jgi:anion transporter